MGWKGLLNLVKSKEKVPTRGLRSYVLLVGDLKKTGKKEQELKPGRKNAAEKGDRGYKTWTANGVKKGYFGISDNCWAHGGWDNGQWEGVILKGLVFLRQGEVVKVVTH